MTEVPGDGSITYACTGGEIWLDVDWQVTAAGDIAVTRTRSGVTTTLELGTDYSVSIISSRGARVELAAAALSGDVYQIDGISEVDTVTTAAGTVTYVLARWRGAWTIPAVYSRGDAVRGPDGTAYVALVTHTAGAASEPGTGAEWTAKWDRVADAGADGNDGAPGGPGPAGPGVPAGGTTGQVLKKTSDADYDASWQADNEGSSVSLNPATGALIGVNATADTTNRLSVKSDAVLFSHDDVTPGSGDMRANVNKSASAKTASLLFQDNWSGRAEIGLCGDDDFHFKVSADGSSWNDAIVINRATAMVGFGTTTPRAPVHIKNVAPGFFLEDTAFADNDAFFVYYAYNLSIQNRTSAGGYVSQPYTFDLRAPDNTIAADNLGNVAIGASYKSARLHVSTALNAATVEALNLQNPSSANGSGVAMRLGPYSTTYQASIEAAGNPGATYGTYLWLRPMKTTGALGIGVFIDTADNVGVGTVSPWEALSLPYNKKISIGASASYNFNVYKSSAGNLDTYLDSRDDDPACKVRFRMRTGGTPVEVLTLAGSGYVGVGTADPRSPIEIYRDTSVSVQSDGIRVCRPGAPSVYGYFAGGYADDTAYIGCVYPSAGGNLAIQSSDGTNTFNVARFENTGNVGIGTSAGAASTKLHVNGPIRCGTYTRATLPSASAVGAGALAFITDGTVSPAAVHVYSNGSAWSRVDTGSTTL